MLLFNYVFFKIWTVIKSAYRANIFCCCLFTLKALLRVRNDGGTHFIYRHFSSLHCFWANVYVCWWVIVGYWLLYWLIKKIGQCLPLLCKAPFGFDLGSIIERIHKIGNCQKQETKTTQTRRQAKFCFIQSS